MEISRLTMLATRSGYLIDAVRQLLAIRSRNQPINCNQPDSV